MKFLIISLLSVLMITSCNSRLVEGRVGKLSDLYQGQLFKPQKEFISRDCVNMAYVVNTLGRTKFYFKLCDYIDCSIKDTLYYNSFIDFATNKLSAKQVSDTYYKVFVKDNKAILQFVYKNNVQFCWKMYFAVDGILMFKGDSKFLDIMFDSKNNYGVLFPHAGEFNMIVMGVYLDQNLKPVFDFSINTDEFDGVKFGPAYVMRIYDYKTSSADFERTLVHLDSAYRYNFDSIKLSQFGLFNKLISEKKGFKFVSRERMSGGAIYKTIPMWNLGSSAGLYFNGINKTPDFKLNYHESSCDE